jgi:hypothetical protein
MRARTLVAACAVGISLMACASPEATRTRGGGPGADLGNHGAVVQLHAGAKMYHRTPCRTAKVKCSGPLPNAGT